MKKSLSLVFVALITLTFNICVCAKDVIAVNHNNTKEQILEIINKYPHSGFGNFDAQYSVQPSFTAPYSAGAIDQKYLDDALNAIKVVRFLAGVPYEHIKLADELNNISQHGAVLLAASNQTGHYPSKPSDMSQSFFDTAYMGCRQANLYYGCTNLSAAVLNFIFDNGQSNIARAGHRRWILKPGADNFGLGFAQSSNASYGGARISMHVFDGPGPWDCEADSYIAWPSAGAFPIQYFAASNNISDTIAAPWSVNLGIEYREPSKNKLTLKLTRLRDNKTWVFDKNTPDLSQEGLSNDLLHLTVDNEGYGITKAIIFRPDMASLGRILDGDIFNVELSGIYKQNGNPATLSYTIEFFDLSKLINNNIVLKIGDRKATVFGNEKWNDVSPVLVNSRTMLPIRFIAENVGAEVLWDEQAQKVSILYKSTVIELFVNSDTAYVNGKSFKIDSPVFIQNSRTYVPVRFVSESLDFDVNWNDTNQEVTITVK